jgi:REP-associated tyrosine transposase
LVFLDRAVAAMVVRQILLAAARFEFAVLAYCLMPDHAHLLVHGRSEHADLRRFAKRTKQSSGQRYQRGANEPLWQEGYYDRVVRPEEDLSGIARYIIENPVRVGLVESPIDYPFVGSELWSVEEIIRRW